MAELVFSLPGIVKSREGAQDFTGPLTLILQLLSRNKVEARDIRVSLILDQYLAWLADMAEMDIDVASEFVAMAAHLTYIKTKTLLGAEQPEELAELISTLERLRATDVYVGIKQIAQRFAELYTVGAGLIPKPPEYFPVDNTYKYSHEPDELVRAFESILLRTVSPDEIKRSVMTGYPRPPSFPIDEKIAELLAKLRSGTEIDLFAMFRSCVGRSETVAAFVAVLGLCADGRAVLSEDGTRLFAGENVSVEADETESAEAVAV